jgi:hypothetical protein
MSTAPRFWIAASCRAGSIFSCVKQLGQPADLLTSGQRLGLDFGWLLGRLCCRLCDPRRLAYRGDHRIHRRWFGDD